jgi:hypothetical protein
MNMERNIMNRRTTGMLTGVAIAFILTWPTVAVFAQAPETHSVQRELFPPGEFFPPGPFLKFDDFDQHYVVCTQSVGARCPNGDALFGGPPQDIGKSMCTIFTALGKQVFPSDVKSRGGGYYDVTCHNMPQDSVIEWQPYNCMSEDQRNCQPRDRYFECGDYPSVARRVCTQNGMVKPYQYFKTMDFNGDRCGTIHLTVGCYVPAPQ